MSAAGGHPIPTSLCPACGYAMDRASALEGDARPREGDLSVCFGCGAVLTFDASLRHKPVTTPELAALQREDPDTFGRLQAAHRLVVEMRASQPPAEPTKGRA